MKAAVMHIAVIEFTCPECGEHISAASGSHMFPLSDPLPEILKCDCCGVELRVPAKARTLKKK
jgi:predicted RNA-binding Zn-ribbon protein involved in translation (DUF1610 family)